MDNGKENGRAGGSIVLLGDARESTKSALMEKVAARDNLIEALKRQLVKTDGAAKHLAQKLDSINEAYLLYCRGDHTPVTLEMFLAALEGALAVDMPQVPGGAS